LEWVFAFPFGDFAPQSIYRFRIFSDFLKWNRYKNNAQPVSGNTMKKRELQNLGLDSSAFRDVAQQCIKAATSGGVRGKEIRTVVTAVCHSPQEYLHDQFFCPLATTLISAANPEPKSRLPVANIPMHSWISDNAEPEAFDQLRDACRLPIAVAGALMPDAHVGYGLPIGGVFAADNAVIPYGVGVDIGCRVKISVTDLPLVKFGQNLALFTRALENQTRFGMGSRWESRLDHAVLDENWKEIPLLATLKDTAWGQLGTSGSGNHFVEFGEFTVPEGTTRLVQQGLESGNTYIALVSHSGSRGTGARIATHYSSLAKSLHPELPPALKKLSWLDLDSAEGQEYWYAMNLMGRYASANHELIHHGVLRAVGARALASFENHHNFAWRETHFGRSLIVHRKGATPAGLGEIGYIPGTMADPGFLVEGTGNENSLRSCSHGAGRALSRKKALQTTTRNALNALLKERKVTTLSCGLDESPHAYKDIRAVMSAQSDLVKVLATFTPRVVKMAPPGEKPED